MTITRKIIFLMFLAVCIVSCSRVTAIPSPSSVPPTPTHALAGITPTVISVPDTSGAAREYLDYWKAENYEAMYGMLTRLSQDSIKKEDFIAKYTGVANEAALKTNGIDYQILSSFITPDHAEVGYQVTLHSLLVGDVLRDTSMNLSLENGQWKIQWDDALILPELKGGNHLKMDSSAPARANIYDLNGHALVAQSEAVAIGLEAGKVPDGDDGRVANVLHRLMDIDPNQLLAQLTVYRANNWYLPVGDLSADDYASLESEISGLPGIVIDSFKSRFYRGTGTIAFAAHATGFMSLIQKEEVDYYKRLGYNSSDWVGRTGLERWGEPYLGGKRGATLYVVDPNGNPVHQLAKVNPAPSQAIYSTLDINLQKGAQEAIAGFKGAIVVMEKNSGRVLALVSSPSFDPNLFEPTNFNQQYLINDLWKPESGNPTFNRATMGKYPLGSVFKIITMSSGLNSGVYTADSTYECGYHFTELPGTTLNDWTWDHFQKDGKTQPSGHLTLPQGLMRSCNPFFWSIGLNLFDRGMVNVVTDMAKSFGLGQKTGIIGLDTTEEEAGQVLTPGSQLEATNQAIGQGTLQVTPLQVADFVAAVGNGGTLYQPSLVERIASPEGNPTYVYTNTIRGHLAITGTNLQLVQNAMLTVITDPHGTAHSRFAGFTIPVAGKTGTAQDTPRDPHAWFVAYTLANNPAKPDIAIAVIVENQGEGLDWAAPITRRVLEIYFFGKPLVRYPWESEIGVVRTPTPEVTNTPVPQATDTPTP